jgi:uncharacterized protein (DUF2062 family)
MDPFGRSTLLAAALATTLFGVLPAVGRAVFGSAPLSVLTALAVATVAYAAALWLLRRPLDLQEMMSRGRRRRSAPRAAADQTAPADEAGPPKR